MNYEELQKANGLLEEIKEIDLTLSTIKTDTRCIKIGVKDYLMYFDNKHKEKFIPVIKEIRDELVKELKELGVTEDINDD